MYELNEILNQMRERGMNVPELPTRIKIENGTSIMMQYFQYFINQRGETFVDRPEYAEVGKWLEDNQCKGSFSLWRCWYWKKPTCADGAPGNPYELQTSYCVGLRCRATEQDTRRNY
jgi:hypothetical protein